MSLIWVDNNIDGTLYWRGGGGVACPPLTQLFNEIQAALIEVIDGGLTMSSGMWTVQEVTEYIQQRQRQILKDTGIILKRATDTTTPPITTIAGGLTHDLPTDWIITQRIVWVGTDGNYTEIPRGDGWEGDAIIPGWPGDTQAIPSIYMDVESANLKVRVAPAPSDLTGHLEIIYVALLDVGDCEFLPDIFLPALKWGAIADMLGKVGRAQDPPRAEYAEMRFQEAVEAGRLILMGWA